MKLYLWDQAAADFCKKFNSYDNTPTVLLVTAVNTKRLGGNQLSLWTHISLIIVACFEKDSFIVRLRDTKNIFYSINVFLFVIDIFLFHNCFLFCHWLIIVIYSKTFFFDTGL